MKIIRPVGVAFGAAFFSSVVFGFVACGSSDSAGPSDASAPNDSAPPSPDAGKDSGPGRDGGTQPVNVTVHRGTTLATIGPAFAGFSYEKKHLMDGFFKSSNGPLVALFKLLGPSVLRVGGNSVDETKWDPTGTSTNDAGANDAITPAMVDDLAGFAKSANWTVIYGVNLKTSTPALAGQEALTASTALDTGAGAKSLYGFEIGNECDLYPAPGTDAATKYEDFIAKWESFASAIRTAVPGAPLTGPASASHYAEWTVPFAKSEASRIELLTQHYYRGNGQDATSTLEELLAPDPKLLLELQALDGAAKQNRIAKGYRMAETNSFYNGGRDGVSDAYGTALWAIDYLFTNAKYGSSGINFHAGGNGSGYTPIGDANGAVVAVRPEFYGMLLFTRAGTGAMYATDVANTSLNFTAYAVGQADGSTRVVAVNKDDAVTVHATIDIGKAVANADVQRLEGPDLADTGGPVTFGGASVTAAGVWQPKPPAALSASGNIVTVDVPPASAVLVQAK